MVAESSGWMNALRDMGVEVESCFDHDAYRLRMEHDGTCYWVEVTGMAIANCQNRADLQHLVRLHFQRAIAQNELRLAQEEVARARNRPAVVMPQPADRPAGLTVDHIMRETYGGAIREFMARRADIVEDEVYADYQYANRPANFNRDAKDPREQFCYESEVKAKLYLRKLIGYAGYLKYAKTHLVCVKTSFHTWYVGLIQDRNMDQRRIIHMMPQVGVKERPIGLHNLKMLCIATAHEGWIPFTDQVLTMALLILADEDGFYDEANTIEKIRTPDDLKAVDFVLK